MAKEIIFAAVFVITTISVAILISEPAITFKPFSISVRAWYKGAFYLLLIAIYITVSMEWKAEHYKGVKDGISATIDYIIEQQNNKQNGTEQHQNGLNHQSDARQSHIG